MVKTWDIQYKFNQLKIKVEMKIPKMHLNNNNKLSNLTIFNPQLNLLINNKIVTNLKLQSIKIIIYKLHSIKLDLLLVLNS